MISDLYVFSFSLLRDEIFEHYGHCNSDDEDAYDRHAGKHGVRAP